MVAHTYSHTTLVLAERDIVKTDHIYDNSTLNAAVVLIKVVPAASN